MAPKIVCVVGPTACGKTTLGVLLAKKLDGEVISADSMQIYRGMTIGTAAPTAAEMDDVPHHMIAVADPAEQWSVARYAQAAIPIVDDILARGKVPILVGGTGLWLDAGVKGHGFAGGHNGGEVRKELQKRLEAEGIGPLLAELRQVDPEAADRLHPSDEKRILRALEVWRETGKTITAHNAETKALPPRYDAVWIGLQFRDRQDMKDLIDRRVDKMAEEGLVEEVRRLLRSGAQIDPLATILGGTFRLAVVYGILTFVNIAANYMTFYRESKSIYLMRRIPDRWELPRRCAAVPLIGLAAGLILTAILICLCNLIYFKATPPQCIPAGEHFLFWRAFG